MNFVVFLVFFYKDIASTGHSSTQAPQSVQVSGSTFALSFNVMASTGQASTQTPHEIQVSSSTSAGMVGSIIKGFLTFSPFLLV
jgi:hypothetical protein